MDATASSVTINADGFGNETAEKKSANQLYRESGSKAPFKQWLLEMQGKGFLNDTAEEKKAKRQETMSKVGEGIGQGIGLISDIVGMVKDGKKKKAQDKLDKQMDKITANDLNTPAPNTSAGIGGVPVGVWYGVGAVTVMLVGYFVYKNFIATPDGGGAVAPAAPAK